MRAKVWFSGKTFLRKRPLHSCASKSCTLDLSIKPAARFYGSHERAKTLLEMLATMLQTPESFSWDLQRCCKRQKIFRETCNGVANAEKFFVGLATLLQTPKSFSWLLQHSCKPQKILRGLCSIPANHKKFFEAFAALLQTPKSFSRLCSIPANTKKFFGAFAAFLQTPKSFLRHLQRSCKHFQKLCAAFSALSKTFFRDKDPYSFAELAFGMCFVQIFCIVRSMYAHCEGPQIDIPSIFAPNKRDFT